MINKIALNTSYQILICFLLMSIISFSMGFVFGQIIGEYNQLKFTEELINKTANTNEFIKFSNNLYRVTPYTEINFSELKIINNGSD